MPALYVERVRTYTAVQWDGSDDAAMWIVANVPGASRDGEQMVIRDSMDREEPIDQGVWVVMNNDTADVVTVGPEEFGARYQPSSL